MSPFAFEHPGDPYLDWTDVRRARGPLYPTGTVRYRRWAYGTLVYFGGVDVMEVTRWLSGEPDLPRTSHPEYDTRAVVEGRWIDEDTAP